jgi:hypothetical protein
MTDRKTKRTTGKDIGRQYRIWLWLLMKRLLKQPMFVALLLLIPIIGCGISLLEQEGSGGAVAAVYVADGEWSGQIRNSLKALSSENSGGGVIQYRFYDSDMEIERAVLTYEVDCGFVIGDDIAERVQNDDWRECIRVYTTESSSITGMAKERIAGVIFRLYSEDYYQKYMRQMGEDATFSAEDSISAEMDADKIAEFAQQAYETHLVDGSTFSFTYDDQDSQYSVGGNDSSVFPVKGVFAVLIFISGMCGMLEYERDKREQRFNRLAPNWMTYIVNIWVTSFLASVAVYLCLWLTGDLQNTWLHQAAALLVYQWIIVLYCCILRVVLHRQETIAVAIPIFALCSMICTPVFVKLSLYVPIFKVLEKMFPVTYYLRIV